MYQKKFQLAIDEWACSQGKNAVVAARCGRFAEAHGMQGPGKAEDRRKLVN
jgi:hypothetical protein